MLKLIKHTARISLTPRLTAFAIVVLSNLFFLIWNLCDPNSLAVHIVAVSVTGSALAALFIVQVISDGAVSRDLFKAPTGYMTLLTPAPGWKILLSRTIAIVAQDVIGLAAGIIGVVYHSLVLGNVSNRVFNHYSPANAIAWGVVIFVLIYLLIVQAIFFAKAMSAGVFYNLRAKKLLGLLSALAALYIMSFTNFILLPFGAVVSYGSLFNVTIGLGFNAGMVVYIVLSLCKSAALFFVTSHLIERKINL